jgi:hypothetical protein
MMNTGLALLHMLSKKLPSFLLILFSFTRSAEDFAPIGIPDKKPSRIG